MTRAEEIARQAIRISAPFEEQVRVIADALESFAKEERERPIFQIIAINYAPYRYAHWGWHARFEDAERAICENHTDLFECRYYLYAYIEESPMGTCSIPISRTWFRAVYDGRNFVDALPITQPEECAGEPLPVFAARIREGGEE